jgi:ATP-binding cassette subfamily F protein 3
LIDERKLKTYTGNYDAFERERHLQTEQIVKDAERHESEKKRLQSFVDRFRYKASKAKQAQSRLKMIERLGEAPKIPAERGIRFRFPPPLRLASYLFSLENAACGYDDKQILSGLNFSIAPDDKLALLGANGNGKSTLAKLLAGRLSLQGGKMTRARKLKIAYFAQHQAEEFDPDKTPYQTLKPLMPDSKEAAVYTRLAGFGLEKSKADIKIGNLSGGEKSRLLLAVITSESPHILILDEPTNHLDIASRKALIEALNDFDGAVILITHDFNIIENVCDELMLVEDGSAASFAGDIEDYKNHVLRNIGRGGFSLKSNRTDLQKDKRRKDATKRKELAPVKKQIKELEVKIEKLSRKRKEIEGSLIRTYSQSLSKDLAFLNIEIGKLEEKWLNLTALIEEE